MKPPFEGHVRTILTPKSFLFSRFLISSFPFLATLPVKFHKGALIFHFDERGNYSPAVNLTGLLLTKTLLQNVTMLLEFHVNFINTIILIFFFLILKTLKYLMQINNNNN